MVSHCGFDLHLPNVYVLFGHVHIFREMSIQALCPVINGIICSVVVELGRTGIRTALPPQSPKSTLYLLLTQLPFMKSHSPSL